jgi:CO/xanthine dehydrogenase Mo-binding subunit
MSDTEGSNGERKEFKIVGKPNIPGRLSYSIATGKAKFGTDIVVPDMLFAKFLRSPYGRARVKNMDIGRAKILPGVVEIITCLFLSKRRIWKMMKQALLLSLKARKSVTRR